MEERADLVKKKTDDEDRKGTKQDKGVKRSKRGKDTLQYICNPRERSKSLHNRRKGLFQSGHKLNRMTGADILIIVQNDRERRYYATGSLRENYLNGNLRGSGKEEVMVMAGQGISCNNGAVVCPLEATPSPSGPPREQRLNGALDIVGHPKSRRSLSMSTAVTGQAVVPEPVRKLLADKPVPVVLSQDVNNNKKANTQSTTTE